MGYFAVKDVVAVALLVVMLTVGLAIGAVVVAYVMVAIPMFVLTVCLGIPTDYAAGFVMGMYLFFFCCHELQKTR